LFVFCSRWPSFLFLPEIFSTHYVLSEQNKESKVSEDIEVVEEKFVPTYVATPPAVKGIYMTSWVASRKDLRENLVKLIDDTEVRAQIKATYDVGLDSWILWSASNKYTAPALQTE